MAISMSKTDLRRAATRAEALRKRLSGMRVKGERVTAKVVHTAEVSAAAFTAGVIQGRTGGIEIMGAPLELILGAGLNLGGFFGLGGKMSDHLHGFGDGFLAAYLTTVGRGVGVKMAAAAPTTQASVPGARSSGSLGAGALSDSEMAQAVAEAVEAA